MVTEGLGSTMNVFLLTSSNLQIFPQFLFCLTPVTWTGSEKNPQNWGGGVTVVKPVLLDKIMHFHCQVLDRGISVHFLFGHRSNWSRMMLAKQVEKNKWNQFLPSQHYYSQKHALGGVVLSHVSHTSGMVETGTNYCQPLCLEMLVCHTDPLA